MTILLIETFSDDKKLTLFSLITSSFIVKTIGFLVIEYVNPLIQCSDEVYGQTVNVHVKSKAYLVPGVSISEAATAEET